MKTELDRFYGLTTRLFFSKSTSPSPSPLRTGEGLAHG